MDSNHNLSGFEARRSIPTLHTILVELVAGLAPASAFPPS